MSFPVLLFSLLLSVSCKQAPPPVEPLVVNDAALADEAQGDNWLAYGRTHHEQRFSPLDQINAGNVADLKVDWYLDLPDRGGLVSTPLVVDGVLYFVGSMNIVRAVNAVTGELLWEYDPKVADHIADRIQVGWMHNRGITFWEGKVFVATWDGRLNAVDAATGEELWSTLTVDREEALYITGAPKAFKGKVLVGNGGTENGPTRGYVTAYDAETGEQAWRFYIVPGNPANGFENEAMAMAAETWTGEWWKHGGGGNAWHGFTYDPEFDAIYIGTGNGSPWNRKIRSPEGGDNLFLCSIVALDPDTGEYRWHYQTTPGETWDYNSNMDIVLADLNIDGKEVKALLHAPKNGFFYVIDRANGKLISAEPFAETTWASRIDLATGRPVEVPGARYEEDKALIMPNPWGAHSWHAMSFNPQTGLAYIPTIHASAVFSDAGIDLKNWQARPFIGGVGVNLVGDDTINASTLQAWDPVRQEVAWQMPLSGINNAGTLTTAGNLVFQGQVNGDLAAYRADTGEELWKMHLGLGISAPPITYAVDGRQYLALLVGWGGGVAGLGGPRAAAHGWAYGIHTRRLVVFSLEGEAVLPALPDPLVPEPIAAPSFSVDPEMAQKGAMVYGMSGCSMCHGNGAITAGMAPDLRASPVILSDEVFAGVVRGGDRRQFGMPQYAHLQDEELTALQHFIRLRAEQGLPEGRQAAD